MWWPAGLTLDLRPWANTFLCGQFRNSTHTTDLKLNDPLPGLLITGLH